jgi:two-component system response regulator
MRIMNREEDEILLVEDNAADVELTLHALSKEHLANRIRVARDGEEALDYLFLPNGEGVLRPLPILILLDLKLPKVNGLEVLRKVKADPRTKSVPVVILTSSREERDIIEGYALGVNSYIQKPLDFVQFRDTIRQLGKYWLVTNEAPHRG